ncbi:CapA family protein [Hamadaea tsunoensis]|uniref:CapA family protein n=1 Tax=Hamadaea tsunoensis TaxID=53368 RepID=UPI00146FB520|nr:CapA family protein [Hamadaea tsunoensis]
MRRALVASLALLLLAACGTATDPVFMASPAPSASAPPASPPAEPSPSASLTGPPPKITLAFAGDVHFTGKTASLLKNPKTAVGPFTSLLSAADLAVVNLETAITTRGTPEPKEFHFRAPATAYAALQAAGVDVASLGNNHALDYGRVGLLDSLDSAKSANMPVIGAGRTEDEAYRPFMTTIKGVKIAVLAMSQIHTLAESWAPTATRPGIAMAHDLDRAAQAVRDAKAQADVVIVFMHWGVEGSNCPKAEMTTLAHRLASAGATMIVGTHAHVPLAGGWMGSTYVHYGLGNFVWYTGGSTSPGSDTEVLTVTLTGTRVTATHVTPGIVTSTGQPAPATGSRLTTVTSRMAAAARCSGLAASPS